MMRYVVFGDETTVPGILDALEANVFRVVLASNRSRSVEKLFEMPSLKPILRIQPSKSSNEYETFIEDLKACSPDYFICFSYSMILSKEVLDIARLGAINLHGGLLPQFRGANIYNWVLIEDEKQTGMTAHFMTEEVDAGDIIFEERIPVTDRETAKSLKDKVDPLGFMLIKQIKRIVESGGELPRSAQQKSQSHYYKRRHPGDGLINWEMSDRQIFNLIRALVRPWPGAHFFDEEGRKIVIEEYLTIPQVQRLREKYGR